MTKEQIQEIIKNNTGEDGAIDFERVEELLSAENQKKIDSIVVANKNKSKDQLKKLEEELEELRKNKKEKKTVKIEDNAVPEEIVKEFTDLKEQIASMKKERQREREVKDFKKKAQILKVNEELVNSFLDSGSDLEKIDLEKFKGKDNPIKELGQSGEDTSSGDSGDYGKIEELLKL